MANAKPHRKSFGENMNIVLVTQVGGVCPRCDVQLMYSKASRKNKNYELAHIYPLHPTGPELLLLQSEERLSKDVDHEDNLIPLCVTCHTKFDKPRTVDDYRRMVQTKKGFIEAERQRALIGEFAIEEDISQIIDALYAGEDMSSLGELSLQPKKLEDKLNDTMTNLTKNKIQYCVTNYFMFVRKKLALMEAEKPLSAENISLQIRLFYNRQAQGSDCQQDIFRNIVEWINSKTKAKSVEAPEILASFFVQNCEVFR
ncbi:MULTISPECIES: ABC-three component system protein [unclassified Pseudomonas]